MNGVAEKIATDLADFGGHLECTVCGHEEEVGDIANQLSTGWKKHCGYTMAWVTARQEAERAAQ